MVCVPSDQGEKSCQKKVHENIPEPVILADEEILYAKKNINIRDEIGQGEIEMKHQVKI